MKTRISILLLVAVFLISTAAVAQKPMDQNSKKNRQEMMNPGKKHNAQKVDFLTEEQKQTMKKLRLETAKEVKPLKNELRELMAHQQTLTTANKADLNAINKNIDKMAEIKAEIAKIMAKQHQEFRSQLSEEQLIKFDSIKNKMPHGKKFQNQRNRTERGSTPMHRS